MKDQLTGVPEEYGIADLPSPGKSIGIGGFDEQNLAKPSADAPKNEVSDNQGKVSSGPKSNDY
jgi:hypothetical protein